MSVSSRSVKLSWNSIPNEERNGIIIGYLVRMSFYLPGGSQNTISRTSIAKRITIRGLTPYTSYICTVAAKTSAGTGLSSVSLTVKTNEDGESIRYGLEMGLG